MNATTTTYLVLCDHFGENSNTEHSPVCEYRPGSVDLTETVTRCYYWDDDRPVSIRRWQVRRVEIPAWMSLGEWLRSYIPLKYLYGRGADPSWPAEWQRRLMMLGGEAQLVCSKLLATKSFRNPFRAQLRMQLVVWLEGRSEYDSPFSGRQWECLMNARTAIELKQIDAWLYRSRDVGELVPYSELVPAAPVAEVA